jgi:hypothetical protein
MHRYAKFMSSSLSAASFTIRCFGATLAHGAPRGTDILYALPSCVSPRATHVTLHAWERLADTRTRGSNAHIEAELCVRYDIKDRGRAMSSHLVDHARWSGLDHGTLVWCRTKVMWWLLLGRGYLTYDLDDQVLTSRQSRPWSMRRTGVIEAHRGPSSSVAQVSRVAAN